MKQIYLIIYYVIAKYLPVSYSKFGGGVFQERSGISVVNIFLRALEKM